MKFSGNTARVKGRTAGRQRHSDIPEKLGFVTPPVAIPMGKPCIFTAVQMDKSALEPAPIRSEWVLDGSPQAMCKRLSGLSDRRGDIAHWSCTSGKFNWHYGWDEGVLFLEGEVHITDENGNEYVGEPGVSLFFPAGTSAVWHVPEYVRKIAFNHNPVPRYLHLATRVVDKARAISRKFRG